jgi:antitoxin MazE
MKATIQKWGNSLGVRIPSMMAKDLMLENGSEVELIEEADKIIIQPQRTLLLDALLDAINETNLHSEIDVNGPIGNEAW